MDTATLTRQQGRIAEWLSRVLLPDQIVEVRALRPFASRTFALTEAGGLERLAVFAAAQSGRSEGVYFTPNPLARVLGSGSGGTAQDQDVAERRWLLIDADAVRPDRAHCSATAAEREAAMAVTRSVRDTLAARGFAGMVLGDSANGGHVMVPIRLPNDDAAKEQHRVFLRCLHERFGTSAVEIDQKTFNAGRIWKLPATEARKGPSTEDRPHRYARLVDLPDGDPHRFDQANVAALVKLLSDWDRGRRASAGEDDRAVLIRRAMAYLEKEPVAVSGEHGHDRCFHAACILVVGFGLKQDEAFAAIQPWNGRCRPPWNEKDLRHKLVDADKETGPRGKLADLHTAGVNGQAKTIPAEVPVNLPAELVILASKIVPRKIEWLWPARVPLNKLTTFAGVGGIGKTFALLDIAARVSRGSEWPECGGECAQAGQTLFITAEDDPDDTLVPRLIEMGADLDNVSFLKSEVADRFTLGDLPTLEKALDQSGSNVRFVAIDPPTAFLGGVNDHRNSELRGLLGPLKTFAQRHRVAIVFVTHLTKPQGTKIDAMMRIMGSVAWVNAVRAAHLFLRDPEDSERRIFACVKINNGPEPKALGYKLALTQELAKIEWLGIVETTADEAMSGEGAQPRKRRVVAAAWLEELFENVDELRSKEIWNGRKVTTISEDALKEAKEDLGFRARQVCDPNGKNEWWWYWPRDARLAWAQTKKDRAEVLSFQ